MYEELRYEEVSHAHSTYVTKVSGNGSDK